MKNALFTTLFALTAFVLLAPLSHAQISLPITFEDAIDYELTDFGGNASSLVADPDDGSNTVVQSIRTLGAECFAGTTVANASGFTSPIPFAPGETKMNVRVWSPMAGIPVRFKVEKFNDPTRSVEAEKLTTIAGAWETIVYDFIDDKVPGTADINFAFEYDKASIFFDFSCPGPPSKSEATYYWDDVAFGGVPSIIESDLEPVGSTVVPFDGGSISYSVMLTNTTSESQTFSARIDAIAPNSVTRTVRGPRGVTLMPGQSVGPFTFTNNVPAIALQGTYTVLLIVSMEGTPISSDSFTFVKEGPPSSITLPITFEDPIDYELVDFGGNASTLVPDPAGRGGNTVVQSIRTVGAECFAGTSVGAVSGFAEPIPFAPGLTTMSVRVWSPLVGISVKLKVEQTDNPAISVETDQLTTVANTWETLFFDFDNESPGTAPINFANTYNEAAIFFNFQCPGPPSTSEEIYFWDDIEFIDGTQIAPLNAASRSVTVDAAYPNPFARSATIPFAVESATDVHLAVYDVMGREVAVLIDGTVEAGRHEARFDGQNLASGLYVWKLTAGDQARTGSLTLVR